MSPVSGVGGISPIGGVGYLPVSPASPSVEIKTGKTNNASSVENADNSSEEVKQKKRLGIIECDTCKNRTYQDGSDDPGVSFKSPTKLNPAEAASAVPAHEREHYGREAAKAAEEDREVISNNIRIFTSVCPECGKTYVSGGVTTTVTKAKSKDENELMNSLFGKISDDEKDPNSVFNVNLRIANGAYGLNYDTKQ